MFDPFVSTFDWGYTIARVVEIAALVVAIYITFISAITIWLSQITIVRSNYKEITATNARNYALVRTLLVWVSLVLIQLTFR